MHEMNYSENNQAIFTVDLFVKITKRHYLCQL